MSPSPEAARQRKQIAQCDRKLGQYRAALDAGGDAAIIGGWIAETHATKLAAEAQLRRAAAAAPRRMSREEIETIVKTFADPAGVVRDADPADKAELYMQLGLKLTYNPSEEGRRTVSAQADLGRSCTKESCPEGSPPGSQYVLTTVFALGARS